MKIAAIVTDIEGTTSSIGFVHEVLFPYSLKHIGDFVTEHREERDVMRILIRLSEKTGLPLHNIGGIVAQLEQWILADEKITELKALQGLVWENAYKQGRFQSHVYADVPEVLRRWHEQELNLYVYSSGSVKAQQLFFRYSIFGDLRLMFSGYYDTTIGPKRETDSYRNIAQAIALEPQSILYLSDVREELDAAAKAGMKTCWVIRPQDTSLDPERARLKFQHPVVTSFDQIQLD
jgi:enolase-phosphatase E1